jgi:hypothetical protein
LDGTDIVGPYNLTTIYGPLDTEIEVSNKTVVLENVNATDILGPYNVTIILGPVNAKDAAEQSNTTII